jgi:hypothetical protein
MLLMTDNFLLTLRYCFIILSSCFVVFIFVYAILVNLINKKYDSKDISKEN